MGPYFTGGWCKILLMKNEKTRRIFSNKVGIYAIIPLILKGKTPFQA
jgi:hypothetical protein